MRSTALSIVAGCGFVVVAGTSAFAQSDTSAAPVDTGRTEIRNMVARLDLEKYKATVKGLTQFGDRRQGTDRNRAAVDWIEAQLKSYGCTPTERIKYIYTPPPPRDSSAAGRGRGGGRGGGRGNAAQGGGRLRGIRTRTGVNTDSLKQTDPKLRALQDQVERKELEARLVKAVATVAGRGSEPEASTPAG